MGQLYLEVDNAGVGVAMSLSFLAADFSQRQQVKFFFRHPANKTVYVIKALIRLKREKFHSVKCS